nr:MAG TPA: hypothetical protein [Caudoviricetes sp.]
MERPGNCNGKITNMLRPYFENGFFTETIMTSMTIVWSLFG